MFIWEGGGLPSGLAHLPRSSFYGNVFHLPILFLIDEISISFLKKFQSKNIWLGGMKNTRSKYCVYYELIYHVIMINDIPPGELEIYFI